MPDAYYGQCSESHAAPKFAHIAAQRISLNKTHGKAKGNNSGLALRKIPMQPVRFWLAPPISQNNRPATAPPRRALYSGKKPAWERLIRNSNHRRTTKKRKLPKEKLSPTGNSSARPIRDAPTPPSLPWRDFGACPRRSPFRGRHNTPAAEWELSQQQSLCSRGPSARRRCRRRFPRKPRAGR